MWDRPYVPRLETGTVPWADAPPILGALGAGTTARLLSRDPGDGAASLLWRLPAGWRHDAFSVDCDLQLFVVAGTVELAGRVLGAGAYCCVPAGGTVGPVASRPGAELLALWDGAPAAGPPCVDGPAPDVIDTTSVEGRPTPVEGPVPGILVKMLRQVPATGGMTLLMTIPPGWHEPRSEHHDCVEESFKLAGAIRLVENGREQVLSAGDYFYRPPRIKHGPMWCDGGTTSLIRFSATPVNHYGPL